MKSLQFQTVLLSTTFAGDFQNQPRVLVYLNGFNDIGNGFQSYNLDPMLTVGGDPIGLSTANFDFGLQPIIGTNNPPAVGFPTGRPTTFQYVVTLPALGQTNAAVIPQGFARTLFQTMQQIAEHKPFVKYIKVQLYNYVPGFADLLENLGKLYIGKMADPLFGDKPEADVFDLKQYYKPDPSNAGFASPQDYLQNLNNFSTQLKYIEIDVPVNRQIDGNTLIAITAPVLPFSQVSQFVTMYM